MRRTLSAVGLAAVVLAVAACGSSSSSSSSPAAGSGSSNSSGTMLLAKSISGTTVLTNSAGLTVYWFSPDTSSSSKCTTGACLAAWPVVKGPVTAGSGVTGSLGTITRSDGTVQATYNGHPLYTYAGDSGPGQVNGNGITSFGGTWHEVTVSGAAPAPSASTSSAGGYGY